MHEQISINKVYTTELLNAGFCFIAGAVFRTYAIGGVVFVPVLLLPRSPLSH